jgi:coatomer protein complex subunit epsilon
MESDPLFHVKQLFYQGTCGVYDLPRLTRRLSVLQRYTLPMVRYDRLTLAAACIAQAAPDQHAALSDAESVDRTLYAARAYLALSNASAALALVSSPAPQHAAARYNAVCAFAHYLANGRDEAQVEQLRDLVLEYEGDDDDANDDEAVVRAIAGTVFILHGEIEEAVATLTEGRGKRDLEWYVHSLATRSRGISTAILVQLLLSLDRKDLAQSTYAAAKTWGDDSLLVQTMEAWIGLKSVRRSLSRGSGC